MTKLIHRKLLARTEESFPRVHQLVKTNGVVTLEKKDEDELFDFLVRTVIGQQLSKKAASTIWSRVTTAIESVGCSFQEFCRDDNVDILRNCGLSRFKVKALIHLRNAFEAGEISGNQLSKFSHEEIVREIKKLWGFGQWSAEMVSMFFYAQPNVWSDKDAALTRGILLLSGNNKSQEDAILNVVTPYKSYLALHIWRGVDSGRIEVIKG
jgi:DNA-3-methyladenine glycosylase II